MDTNVKTSIPISVELLQKVEAIAKRQHRKSEELVEIILSDYTKIAKEKRQAREIEILNRISEEQHDEIMETLEYQTDW